MATFYEAMSELTQKFLVFIVSLYRGRGGERVEIIFIIFSVVQIIFKNFDRGREIYHFWGTDTDLISRFFWPCISYRLIYYTYNEKSKSSNNPSVVRLDTETKMSMVLGHLCATHIMTLYFLKWLHLKYFYIQFHHTKDFEYQTCIS